MSRHGSPCRLAVEAFLEAKRGSVADINAATGYARASVEGVLCGLRRLGSPLLGNLVDGRHDRVRKRLERAQAEARAAEMEAAHGVVETALATRTLLEQAWSAS